MIISIVQYFIT